MDRFCAIRGRPDEVGEAHGGERGVLIAGHDWSLGGLDVVAQKNVDGPAGLSQQRCRRCVGAGELETRWIGDHQGPADVGQERRDLGVGDASEGRPDDADQLQDGIGAEECAPASKIRNSSTSSSV